VVFDNAKHYRSLDLIMYRRTMITIEDAIVSPDVFFLLSIYVAKHHFNFQEENISTATFRIVDQIFGCLASVACPSPRSKILHRDKFKTGRRVSECKQENMLTAHITHPD